MLYDPKWEAPQVKANPFSLESLIAWLEKQPTDRQYCFTEWGECLIAKWLLSIDPRSHLAQNAPTGFYYVVLEQTMDFNHFGDIAAGMHWGDSWTFGAALARAREELAAR